MECKFCGDIVNPGDSVCQSCGRSVGQPEKHYRNDKLEKNDDLKEYYKSKTKRKGIPKLVVFLLLLFFFPFGVIAFIFWDFKVSTKILFVLSLSLVIGFFMFMVTESEVVTESVIVEEAVAIEEKHNTYDPLTDESLVILEALGLGTITSMSIDQSDVIQVSDGTYTLEVVQLDGELLLVLYGGNQLYNATDGFIQNIEDVE